MAAASPKPKAWYDQTRGLTLGPGSLDIGLNLRTRYEYLDNFDVRGYGAGLEDHLLLVRTRLSLDYHFGKPAHVYVEMQDARYWLSDLDRATFTGSNPFHDENELRQAYFEWQKIAGSPAGFKAGRQTITYGDRRVFGPGEWGNVGRYWWDAAKLYCHTDPVQVDLLYGRQIVSDDSGFNDEHFPFEMAAAYAQFRQFTNRTFTIKPDVFYVGRYDTHGDLKGESGVGDEFRHTLGFRFDGRIRTAWDYYGTVAGQFGTYGEDDIATFGAVAGAGYTFPGTWAPPARSRVRLCQRRRRPNRRHPRHLR